MKNPQILLGPICDQIKLCQSVSGRSALNAEEKLFRKLFDESGYDKRARPVKDADQPVIVSFRLDYNQLYEIVSSEPLGLAEISPPVTVCAERKSANGIYSDNYIRKLGRGQMVLEHDGFLEPVIDRGR